MDSIVSAMKLALQGWARHFTFSRLLLTIELRQESFNSRLKAEGDEGSTNLYISNLPKSLTEVVSESLQGLTDSFLQI